MNKVYCISNKINNKKYVGFTSMTIAERMGQHRHKAISGKSKSIIHILGGPEISFNRISSLPDPSIADYYIIGEGEKRLYGLISYLKAKKRGLNVKFPDGIAFYKNNKLNYTESTDNITNLDEIPSVYLTKTLDDSLYARQQAFLETQRGCKFKCKYCVYHKNLPNILYYSLERIFAELDHLIVEKRVRATRIFDAIFTSDIHRAKEIVKHLLELKNSDGIRLPWLYWEFTPYNIDEEFIKLIGSLKYREKINNSNSISPLERPQLYSDMLKDYTAVNCIGIQSLCKEALRAVSRASVSPEKLDTFMDMIKKYNIVLKVDLIMDLPFETFDSYFEGLEFLLPYFKDTDHILNIHRLQILPGSELEALCEEYRITYLQEAPHLVFSTRDFSAQKIKYASKLTAVLFRVLNSPLRKYLFQAKERTEESFFRIIESIFSGIVDSEQFKETKLIRNDYVDDVYWNNEVYREIHSEWLLNLLKNHGKTSLK